MNEFLLELHQLALANSELNFAARLLLFAEALGGAKFGAWCDGSSLSTLDDFNYELHLLDCVTYVEVVLALAKTDPNVNSENFCKNFEGMLRSIHYAQGIPTFINRNHFTCIDWIENNKFILEDITHTISPKLNSASTTINKLAWIQKHRIMQQIGAIIPDELKAILQPQDSMLSYIKIDDFIAEYSIMKNNFPVCSIICIVRPNWDLTEQIGTHLNISHLGFAFYDQAQDSLMFYHSSINLQGVGHETLLAYLTRFKDSPTIDGFSVLTITPGYMNAR